MKKVTVAILAILYLAVSSGVAMNIHYCMGKFSSVDFYSYNDKCGKCGMKKADGCCKDEFKIIKLNDTHKLISNNINIFEPVLEIDNSKSNFDSDLHYSQFRFSFNIHSPPEPSGTSLCIMNRVFRI
jgi:hypothetical protein